MSMPLDLVLSRLAPFKLHQNGRDRWRACCPAHGGSNPSVLSVGIGDNGAVLMRCFHGCAVDAIAGALGLELSDLFPTKDSHARPLERRRMLSARQALDLLVSESLVVFVVGADMHRQRTVSDADFDRLQVATARIQALGQEVLQ
jgi:hypothetical protein